MQYTDGSLGLVLKDGVSGAFIIFTKDTPHSALHTPLSVSFGIAATFQVHASSMSQGLVRAKPLSTLEFHLMSDAIVIAWFLLPTIHCC